MLTIANAYFYEFKVLKMPCKIYPFTLQIVGLIQIMIASNMDPTTDLEISWVFSVWLGLVHIKQKILYYQDASLPLKWMRKRSL